MRQVFRQFSKSLVGSNFTRSIASAMNGSKKKFRSKCAKSLRGTLSKMCCACQSPMPDFIITPRCEAHWCNWLTRRPLKAESTSSILVCATNFRRRPLIQAWSPPTYVKRPSELRFRWPFHFTTTFFQTQNIKRAANCMLREPPPPRNGLPMPTSGVTVIGRKPMPRPVTGSMPLKLASAANPGNRGEAKFG